MVRSSTSAEQTPTLVSTGYAVPHWPEPFGRGSRRHRAAGDRGGVQAPRASSKPSYSITGWVILTLIQHGTDDQVARWVQPALDQEVIWCRLFSEPDAGSDAAGVKTKATASTGAGSLNGQKVWTSGAHVAGFGLATVHTDPDIGQTRRHPP